MKEVSELATVIKKAFYIASSGRPGPVLVDLPKDITAESCVYEYPQSLDLRSYKPAIKGHPRQIKKAVELLLSAKKPMIYSGGGVVLGEASAELTSFTQKLGYPITNTLMGLGAYPATDKQFVGDGQNHSDHHKHSTNYKYGIKVHTLPPSGIILCQPFHQSQETPER